MAEKKKKIPCRVCGKLFTPCAYCQAHADVFRWRNFACSRECALKYINDTIAYRESLKNKDKENIEIKETETNEEVSEKPIKIRKRNYKKSSEVIEDDNIENGLENNKTK